MMTRRKIFIITGLFLLIITCIRILWNVFHTSPDHPLAVRGELDLRNWDFAANRPITLDGEWELFPDLLLMSGNEQAIPSNDRDFIQVPGNWSTSPSKVDNAYGYATYRLRVLVDPDYDREQSYAIHVPGIAIASELFVNGQSLMKSGQPASAKDRYEARITPYTVTFATGESVIEIVIHASNFDDPHQGGITKSLVFGSGKAVTNRTLFSMSMQLLVSVVLLIHAIYAFILYIVGYRHKSLIFFSLAVVSATLMTLVDDDQLLFVWLPVSYEWFVKIYFLTYTVGAVFLLQVFRYMFPEHGAARFLHGYTAMVMVYILFLILAPVKWILLYIPLFYIIYWPLFIVLPGLAFRTVSKHREDIIYLILFVTAIGTNVTWGMMINLGWFEKIYYPLDLIIAFFTFATFCLKRFIRTSEQTATLAKQLQREDKMKDDFLANTSHELRTPLHGIINIAQTVLDNERALISKKNVKNIELLIDVGRRMSMMINDLLDLTQIKEGRVRIQLSSIKVQSVASAVIDMLRFMTEGKQIQLEMNISDSFPSVAADRERLVQVLYNLVHNAIKFTNEGVISILAEVRDHQAYLSVSDTGAGIDEELQRRVFQPYEQGRDGRADAAGGMGLGLTICQQIIELHGGTLTVRSAPGQGSVFTFNLRLSDATNEEQEFMMEAVSASNGTGSDSQITDQESGHKPSHLANKPKILAVEDDWVNLKIIGEILAADQYEVTMVTNGKEALAKLDSSQWDLMITDVMMPRMSGYELTRRVRERFSISELPILLLTARSQVEDIHSGFLAGANDYVTKPVEAMELKSRVRALTDVRRSVGERLRMEAAYLQAQIKPHFLFNTLNSITALSDIDLGKMNDLIEAFSSYLRLSFDVLNSEQLVPIEHELELVRSYLYIEKQRFEDQLNVCWLVDGNISGVQLPPLTIQPLVENAVRYGVRSRLSGGTVHIQIEKKARHILISISDNGAGMEAKEVERLLHMDANSRGIGLINIDKRLKRMYGKGLMIQSTPERGTLVSFEVPVMPVGKE